MAGARQPPRQKLINMMYLVLTAMLALQVSGAVLEKFILINRSIEYAVRYQLAENNELLQRTEKVVRDSGNREADLAVLNKIQAIREKTEKIISHIEGLKLVLMKNAGNKKIKKGKIKGLKNDHVVTRLMLNKGKGKELQSMLNLYVKFLSEASGKIYSAIALDARNIDFLRYDPNQGRKDFVHLNFYKTPLAAVLATLSQFSSDVVYKEADALHVLSRQLGAEDFKMDTIIPVIIPKSNLVPCGGKYEAEVVAAASSSSSTGVVMKVNGRPISVKNGRGLVKFSVKACNNKKSSESEKRNIKVDIEMKNQRGEPTVITKTFSYFVAKPVIRVESGSVSRLYYKCKNPLNILVPSIGKSYNPKFVAKGAKVINQRGSKVDIVPTGKEVSIDVYQDNILLGTEVFKVNRIPLPSISLNSANGVLDEKKGVTGFLPRNIKVSVIPDEGFKELLPEEAVYRVSKGSISVVSGIGGIRRGEPVEINYKKKKSNIVYIGNIADLAIPGDRLVVEVTELVRYTGDGDIEKIRTGSIVKTIPIN